MASSWVAMPQKTSLAISFLASVEVVGVDVGLGGEGEVGGLLVGAFAEADADALSEQAVGVGFGAEHVGLEDGADGAGVARVEAFCHAERWLRCMGAFHVDADEVLEAVGVTDELADDALGEGLAFG